MPSRNVVKPDVPDSFYHVYARGASKQVIYFEPADHFYFIQLFARYLSRDISYSKTGIPYPHYYGLVELHSFCLMKNHFHLLLYQKNQGTMAKLMKSVMSSYCQYFNLKYGRSGSLWESTYRASRIESDVYLQHISRYIHLNPRYWLRYPYSSIRYYLKESRCPDWLTTEKVLSLFKDRLDYQYFLKDYEEHKITLSEIKHQIANQ